jgi:hypothetical protein
MIFLMLMFTGLTMYAQNSPSDKLFNSLSEKEGVTILSFSKSMLDFVDFDFDDSEITGDLNRIKILIYSTSDVKQPLNLRRQVSKYLSGRYKKVEPSDIDNDADSDDDKYVDIMVLRSGKRVKECHVILADGDDDDDDGGGVIISFFGNFKVEDLKKLASKAEKYN